MMIITDKLNKIKEKNYLDKYLFLYLLVIVIVALCSFYLGNLYGTNTQKNIQDESLGRQEASISLFKINQEYFENEQVSNRKYVASKNGSKYYPIDCKIANRINEENMIYFSTQNEAIMSGYELSKTCQ